MKRTRVAVCALTLIALVTVTGCSSSGSDSASPTTAKDTGGGVKVTTPSDVTTITIVADDTKGTDGPMTFTMSTASVPAGKVRFVLKNEGTIEHEAIVLKTDTAVDKLVVGADNRVSEKDSVGEVSETKAGATKATTIDLEAGNYLIVCNIAKHYEMGMRSALKVT